MDTLFKRLAEVLTSGRLLYTQMVALSREKREAMTTNKIDELDRVVRDEQNQLVRLQEWERIRKKCVSELALKSGRPADDITMQDFIDAAPSDQRPGLEKLYRELLTVVEEQVKQNDINRQIIESKLEYLNVMVDAMQPTQDNSQVYNSFGGEQERRKAKTSIIDQKA